MDLTCAALATILSKFSLVKRCDVLDDGTLRIATPFQYPNGSFIDVFVHDARTLPDQRQNMFFSHLLSDCGQTAAYLLDLHVKTWTTKRKRQILADICVATGVDSKNGELQIGIEEQQIDIQLAPAMIKLAQACVRIADLSYMQRFPTIPTFRDQVEEFIDQSALDYEPDFVVDQVVGRGSQVDFRVRGRKKTSFVKTISTNNADVAHRQLVEVFAKWYDLAPKRKNNQFITVVEDKPVELYKPTDMKRLEDVSDTIIYFPSEQERFLQTIAA